MKIISEVAGVLNPGFMVLNLISFKSRGSKPRLPSQDG